MPAGVGYGPGMKPKNKPKPKPKVSRPGRKRVSKKISKLHKEGVPSQEAIATALSMEEKKRLTASGGYKRVRTKK